MANESVINYSLQEKQIVEANILGNALLSGLIAEGIAENKRNIKVSSNLKNLHELVNNYKNEVDKIRSLPIGNIFDILEAKDDECFELQIDVAEKLLKKIQDILQAHVKHDASQVVSKEDIRGIEENMNLLTEIQKELVQEPLANTNKLKHHLDRISEIQNQLEKMKESIEMTSTTVNDTQQDVVAMSSNALFLSI